MSFAYNSSIPATNNNPSSDQPIMQTNAAAIENFVNVDHVDFNNSNCGKHLQVTINSKNLPIAQTDPQSVIYTGNGIASTVSQLFYVNQLATFPLSTLRAYANFTVSGTTMTATNFFNVNVGAITGVHIPGTVVFTIPLLSGATSSNDVGIMFTATPFSANLGSWSIAGNVITFNPTFTSASAGFTVVMLVFQL